MGELVVSWPKLLRAAEALYATRWFGGELARQDESTICVYLSEVQAVLAAVGVRWETPEGPA